MRQFIERFDPTCSDSEVHGANMEPIWVLSAPDRPDVGPVNLAIRVVSHFDVMPCKDYREDTGGILDVELIQDTS